MFSQKSRNDLNTIISCLQDYKPFAFVKYADGERAILENRELKNCDGWHFKDQHLVHQDLNESIDYYADNYYYGISCKISDADSNRFYKERLKGRLDKITFADMFVNANHKPWIYFLSNWNKKDRTLAFIHNKDGDASALPFHVDRSVLIPAHALDWYQEDKIDILTYLLTLEEDIIFCAAGPLSEIFIHFLHSHNPNKIYIDVGSSLDPWLLGRSTRHYHRAGSDSERRVPEL